MPITRRNFLAGLGGGLVAAQATARAGQQETPAKRPNILFVFPDQHRYDWMPGAPGLPLRMPHIEGLMARGVNFQRALCPSPLCAPSRACLAMGMEYPRTGVPTNREDLAHDAVTIYKLLRDAGYQVGGTGKFDLNKNEARWGLDGRYLFDTWGFTDGLNNAGKWDAIRSGSETPADPYMKYLHDTGQVETHVADFENRRGDGRNYTVTEPTPLPDEAYCDSWIGQHSVDVIKQFSQDQPWFLQVNFTGPHEPMDITHAMERTCRDRDFGQPFESTEFPPETHTLLRQNYAAMIENIDHWTGAMIDAIEARGELDNTLIVFSSDHGEMLGDHNAWAKRLMYLPSSGVPLVVAGPGVRQGRTVAAPSTILDLTATFLEVAGVKRPAHMDAQSLMPVLTGATDATRTHACSAFGDWQTVYDGQYKLTLGYPEQGDVLLCDVLEDPNEANNLAADKPEVVKRLHALLAETYGESEALPISAQAS